MGKTLPIMRTFFLSLLPVLFLVSCEDSFGIESSFGVETDITVKMGTTSYSPQEQELLIEAVRSRLQVADIVLYNGIYFIELHGGQPAHMDGKVFPFLSSEEAKTWSLNGKDLGIPVQFDEEGKVILPALIPGSEEVWTVDGVETAVSATPYRTFATDAAPLHLTALAMFKDRLFMYGSDGEIRTLPIVTNPLERVPEYWMETLVEKENMAETAIAEMAGDGVSFVFFTDSHWGKNAKKSPALIRHIIDFTPFDDVIFGGDVITTHTATQEEAMNIGQSFQEAFSFLGTRFHCLYGNHDNNSDGQPKAYERHLSDDQVYSWLQSQITDVVRGGPFNYYYDNPEENTRIICLDTGRYYLSMFRDKLPDTVRFAVESLNTLPEGWHAIFASHLWCSSKKQAGGTSTQFIEGYIKPILRVFDAYNDRLKGNYTYSGVSVPYDFTDAGGRIEFCIGGHAHADYTTFSEKGIPVIIVTTDSSSSEQRETVKEQAVNMVVADYKNRKLNLFVVGKGKDRSIDL